MKRLGLSAAAAGVTALSALAVVAASSSAPREAMPMGITIQHTDLGDVFADASGMTLYTKGNGNGRQATEAGTSACDFTPQAMGRITKAPQTYKARLRADGSRQSCAEETPLALVQDGAKPVGKWTVAQRKDEHKQWVYGTAALYTSIKDRKPGDVNGNGQPLYVPIVLPPKVTIVRNDEGQFLQTPERLPLYTHDKDGKNKSNCEGACTDLWRPFLAADIAAPAENWSVVTLKSGAKQWAFKGKPLYTYAKDVAEEDAVGDAVAGWQRAAVQLGPKMPREIATRETRAGTVYTDKTGRSLYAFACGDTTSDGLTCDDPTDRSEFWFTFCGTPANPGACANMWRPMLAAADAKDIGNTWQVVTIAAPWAPVRTAVGSTEETIRVWAHRGRPVFTFYADEEPGDINGHDVRIPQLLGWRLLSPTAADGMIDGGA